MRLYLLHLMMSLRAMRMNVRMLSVRIQIAVSLSESAGVEGVIMTAVSFCRNVLYWRMELCAFAEEAAGRIGSNALNQLHLHE